ncbi:hypothetical protein Hanom_Chr13g01195971 [Helianthus anomalus]
MLKQKCSELAEKDEVLKQKCKEKCIGCFEKDKQFLELKKHNNHLAYDFNKMKEPYDKMSKSTKQFVDLSHEQDATNKLLKATVMDKKITINIHLDTIVELKQELEKAKIETERVNKKLVSYSTSSNVLHHIFPKETEKNQSREGVDGNGNKRLGYHHVPLPMREGYSRKKAGRGGKGAES